MKQRMVLTSEMLRILDEELAEYDFRKLSTLYLELFGSDHADDDILPDFENMREECFWGWLERGRFNIMSSTEH